MECWLDVVSVGDNRVHFVGHNVFTATGEDVVGPSELRFRSLAELAESLSNFGFTVAHVAPLIAGHTADDMSYWIQAYLPGTPMAYLHAQYCDQIIAINRLQATLPPHLHDPAQSWSTYAHRVVFQNESAWFAMLQAYAPKVATFVGQLHAWAQTWKDTPLIHTDAVHGDCTPDNMVVQVEHITGVIDTATMGCGTRAIDLAALALCLPLRLQR